MPLKAKFLDKPTSMYFASNQPWWPQNGHWESHCNEEVIVKVTVASFGMLRALSFIPYSYLVWSIVTLSWKILPLTSLTNLEPESLLDTSNSRLASRASWKGV